jgi:WD40 repeat protein
MNEGRLRELLQEPLPGEREAEERSLEVARAAFEGRRPSAPRPRAMLVLVAGLVLLAIAALAVTPAGGAITDFIGDRIGGVEGEQPSQPALVSLPSGGEVLVNSARGPWILHADGSRRLLGSYDDASWSPRGLYVIATRGRQLVALTPEGEVRWSLARARRVSLARWSPSGFRVAYLSGSSLRVVNGDGSGDRQLAESVAGVAPAWRPGGGNQLAVADGRGGVELLDADRGRRFWRGSFPAGVPLQLEWSADGERLLVVGRGSVREFGPGGRLLREFPLPERVLPRRAGNYVAFARHGHRIALIRSTVSGRQMEVVLLGAMNQRRLFAGPGTLTDVAWSPDGRWLLVAWRSADQWLFLRPGGGQRIVAVSDIARQFNPGGEGLGGFPSVSGWCCPP